MEETGKVERVGYPAGVELASGKVAELVKSFEHANEILDGFRYKIGALNSTPFVRVRLGTAGPTCLL